MLLLTQDMALNLHATHALRQVHNPSEAINVNHPVQLLSIASEA